MRALALGGAAALGLTIAEGALRLKGDIPRFPRFLSARRLPDGSMIRQNLPDAVYWHSSPEGAWEFRIDADGFRHAGDVEQGDPGDRFRILALGDSFTIGYEVAAAQAWPQRLENELEQISSLPVEVINAGVSGFGTAEEYAFLRAEGLRHGPDLVIVGVYANDYQDSARADLFRVEGGRLLATGRSYVPGIRVASMLQTLPGFAGLAQSSHLYALLNERAAMFIKQHVLGAGTPRAATEPPDAGAVRLVAALLERIIDECGDRGVPVLLLDIASREGLDSLPVRQLHPRHRLHVVRTASLYANCCAPEGAFRARGHGHWTPLGHAAAARAWPPESGRRTTCGRLGSEVRPC